MIILHGKPQSTNHLYKHTCRGKFASVYMTKQGKELKRSYQLQAKFQVSKKLKGDIELEVKLYFDDKRRRDIDNYSKILFDSLSGILYDDDSQIVKLVITKGIDKENPRIEINIL